jgi:DNA-binding NarL/FixJ family response regulator
VEGTPNKNIAIQTGLAVRTVEKYRRIVFDKLGVDSAAEATRVWVLATIEE